MLVFLSSKSDDTHEIHNLIQVIGEILSISYYSITVSITDNSQGGV